MKANELMIGDWVYNSYHKKPIQITPFDFFTHSHTEGVPSFDGILNPKPTSGRDLEPIPLTAEILEKNFPNADKVAWWFADDYEDADDRITYEIHISGGALGINGFMWYVHELQHALRLCGLTELADNFKI